MGKDILMEFRIFRVPHTHKVSVHKINSILFVVHVMQ
jgi:hypothetical protein